MKLNFDKVKWLTDEISFLGYEIKNGKMTQEKIFGKKDERNWGSVLN